MSGPTKANGGGVPGSRTRLKVVVARSFCGVPMNRRVIIATAYGMPCGVCALAGVFFLGGCNSEPTGDAAYSQKFEVPPDLAEAAKKPVPLPPTRAEERKLDRAEELKRKARRS